MLVEWVSSKIPRVVRSSFEAEINSAQTALDTQDYVESTLMMLLYNMRPLEWKKSQEHLPSALVGDNKGLYTTVMSANPISTKGEKRLTLEKMIMRDHLKDNNVKYCWTNAGHQLADGFTKLSTAGARSDLLISAIEEGQIQIIYSTQSGRKESQAALEVLADTPQMFSLDQEEEIPEDLSVIAPEEVDDLRQWYYDLR